MKLDRLYVLSGLAWLVVSMLFGFHLGASDQLQYSNSHAHAALLGFVVPVLFGLMLRSWPSVMSAKLARTQFAIYQIGAILLVAGKYSIDGGNNPVLAPIGAAIVVLATVLMGWMFAFHSDAKAALPQSLTSA